MIQEIKTRTDFLKLLTIKYPNLSWHWKKKKTSMKFGLGLSDLLIKKERKGRDSKS